MKPAHVLTGAGAVASLVIAGLTSAGAVAAPARTPYRAADPATSRHAADPGFGPAQRSAAERTVAARVSSTAKALRLSKGEALVVRNVERDADGTEHVHYDRTYDGLRVIGGDLIVHQSAGGTLRTVDWPSQQQVSVRSTTGRIPSAAVAGSNPHKVIYAANHKPVLAWESRVRGSEPDGTPIDELVYTDASTGKRLGVRTNIFTDSGVGKSLYSGKVTVQIQKISGKWKLSDVPRGGHRTYNAGHAWSSARGTLVSSGDKYFGNYSTSDSQSAAVDAHFGAAKTWDFYKAIFARSGIRGDGKGAYSRVHFGKSYENAFWDNVCFCMTYGDGGTTFRQLVALDVAGHEMSHGVTSQTDGLDYSGDAGGLNEATSDVMGTMVEFYANRTKDPGDYYIGEKIVKVKPYYLRRMDNPRSDGHSVQCWTTATKNLDPHYSSGVGNHLFYLLAEGTGAKTIGGRAHNATSCNATTLTGIGRYPAARIWYRAMTTYWLSSETYPGAANGMVKAARDLYGVNSTNCLKTVDAWKAVSVTPTAACDAPGSGDPAGNAIANPGFEAGNTVWSADSGVITNVKNTYEHARTGTWFAWLNGFGSPNTQSVSQANVTIPAAGSATLKYFTDILTNDSSSSANDLLKVQVVAGSGTTTVQTLSNLDTTYGSYDLKAIDLTPWAGQTVTIQFVGSEIGAADGTDLTEFLIDDVKLYTAG